MLAMFQSKPLLDEQSVNWIFETFAWALTHFDREEFFHRTKLLQPTNEFFPGRVDSHQNKAETIFQHTLNYTGLSHWPFKLVTPERFEQLALPDLNLEKIQRHSAPDDLPVQYDAGFLNLTYTIPQTYKSEDLASSFAHLMAQHMVLQSKQLPPGGRDFLIEATELLAIFMGFGVLMANSAYTFRGGCGSCYNPHANRQATMSEDEVLFSLALFCRLKEIPSSVATQHLKKHLKAIYKKALKQIDNESAQVQVLLDYKTEYRKV